MSSKLELYTDKAGHWRWRLRAENNEPIAASSEGYVDKGDALNGIEILRLLSGTTEIYEDAKGEWRWRLTHANGNIICTSGEGYVRRSDCEYGLSLSAKLAKEAPVKEL